MIWSEMPVREDTMSVQFSGITMKEHQVNDQIWVIHIIWIPSRDTVSREWKTKIKEISNHNKIVTDGRMMAIRRVL